jgi:PAS domain S-box-containing protein
MNETHPLFASAELARVLFEESGDALFLLDPETDQILEVNPVALRLTGYHRQELLGISSGSLFRYEANHSHGQHRLRGAFTKTVVFHGQDGYLLRSKQQGWIPVTLTVSRLHLPQRTLGLLVARDDRERRENLQQLRRVEAELRSVLSHSPAALWRAERITNSRGKSTWRFRYISPALGRLIGRPVEAFHQLFQWLEAVHPEDRDHCDNWLKQLLSSKALHGEHQYRICTPQGETRWVRDRLTIVREESGRAIRLDGCLVDVTEQQAAAAELTRQNTLLHSLFASVPDMICYKDRDLRVLGGNAVFAQFAGRPIEQLIGLRCEDVFPVPPEVIQRRRQIEKEVLKTGGTIRNRETIPRPTGEPPLLLDIVVAPLRKAPESPPSGVIIVARDVTEQARLEEQLRQSQKLEALGQLAGGIAHDFNNLLTVILGNLELALIQAEEASPIRACLESAVHAAHQAAELTRQMLGLARRQPLQTVPIDLNTLIREEIRLLRHSIDPRITIHYQPAEEPASIRGDPVQMQQVLMNLCLNARDAMPEGGLLTITTAILPHAVPPPSVGHAADQPKPYVRLSVTDTGCGMTEEVKNRIFDPFFTTKGIGKGTGLGLAVVYGVVRAHEGWIECESAPGQGTRFDIYLPYVPAETPSSPARPETAELPTPSSTEHPSETILVVDDEPYVRAVAVAALQQAGYCVLAAEDGLQAVELFQQAADRIDLIVLDASMPRLCGREAYEQIRQLHPTVPILFASGHSGTELPTDQPHTGFIHKPYTPRALTAAVQQMLRSHGETRAPSATADTATLTAIADTATSAPVDVTPPPPPHRLRLSAHS